MRIEIINVWTFLIHREQWVSTHVQKLAIDGFTSKDIAMQQQYFDQLCLVYFTNIRSTSFGTPKFLFC